MKAFPKTEERQTNVKELKAIKGYTKCANKLLCCFVLIRICVVFFMSAPGLG